MVDRQRSGASDREFAERVRTVLETDTEAFRDRVAAEATQLKSELADGTFDNPQALVGLEYEFYAVDERTGALRRTPRGLLALIGFEKELGLHNAEMQTTPQPLNAYGLAAQRTEMQARLDAALTRTRVEDIRLVSDGLWTIPPEGEPAAEYLTAGVEHDGVWLTTNMSDSVRYQAMANAEYPARMELDAPHVALSAGTVLPESLITSIQPHYQVPYASDLPEYFRYALRIAGPLLALGVNSPFFPPDLYEDVSPDRVLADAWMEHRIGVFETVLNPADDRPEKVTFPRDVETVAEAVDRVADDVPIVPRCVDDRGRFDDAFAHFGYKRGSYWRWVRPVFDGPTRATANARIEFRPLPAQPTIADSTAFLAAFAGLMEELPRAQHPVRALSWDRARESFYAAMRDGIEAELAWITASGEDTTDSEAIYGELIDAARDGLVTCGLSAAEADAYLRPLAERVRLGVTPARWKHEHVRRRIEEGASLEDAVGAMQRAYIDHQVETILEGSFADWIDGDRATN